MKRAVMNYKAMKKIHKFRQRNGGKGGLLFTEGQMMTNVEALAQKKLNFGTITVQTGTR